MMEQAAREKYLDLLLENSPDIILLLDGEGRILYCSRVFLKLTGTKDFSQIKDKTFEEVYALLGDPQFLEQSRERFSQIKAGQRTITENAVIDFSGRGRPRSYSIDSTPIMKKSGGFEGALIIYHDITDLLRAEADERTQAMFDSTPLACTFWDAGGNLVDCNREALKLFGVPTKEEFCRRFDEFSPVLQADGSISRVKIRENFLETCEQGIKKFSWLHRSASGEWLPCYVNLVRVSFPDGYRVLGYTRDLREIQDLEERRRETDERNRELEVSTRAAQAASEAKSKFLASMSHEIRTPMNAIIGMSDLMRTDNLDETQKSFFEDIRKLSKTLLQIINDILDISKIELGKMELAPVHFNLVELYDNICSLNRFSAEVKELEFRQSFAADVPPVIYGDDVRIRQILTNILNNAVKYTREGYVEFTVEKTRRHGKEALAFSVRDTGIGIRKGDFPKLFGNFQQLDGPANRGIMGTGLGLAITKNLVTMMEGEILFDSEYGKGSVFTVFLPLVEGDPDKVERKSLSSRLIAADEADVLVVDDNRINLKVALAFLAAHNIRADTAMDGFEAVDKVKKRAYDIIFMDHMMPGMDGLEAARRIRALADEPAPAGNVSGDEARRRERFKTVPIIALSANAVDGTREMFFAAGMNDFIPKPIDAAALNIKLARWLPAEKIARFEASGSGGPRAPSGGVLDRKAGLANTGGDAALYRRICAGFYEDHGDDFSRIRDALGEGNVTLAHRLAHTLKSAAALIGAGELRGTAMVIEHALAENNTALEKELARLEEDMRKLLSELEADMPGAPVPAAKVPGDVPSGLSAVSEFCDQLEPLLKSGNTESLNYLGEIKKLPPPLDGVGKILVKQIEDFDFPAALETLRNIGRQAEKGDGRHGG
ncbi:MAG: response regulator [Treponema sp.]|jgi:PAS domain S-box-containing protein|nr:response regulator [Treponema sp.]